MWVRNKSYGGGGNGVIIACISNNSYGKNNWKIMIQRTSPENSVVATDKMSTKIVSSLTLTKIYFTQPQN